VSEWSDWLSAHLAEGIEYFKNIENIFYAKINITTNFKKYKQMNTSYAKYYYTSQTFSNYLPKVTF